MLKKLIGLLAGKAPKASPTVVHPADPRSGVAQHLQEAGVEPQVIINIVNTLNTMPADEAWKAILGHRALKGWRRGGRR